MIVCAGGSEQIRGARPIGIGLVDVAANLTALCLETRPTFLLFVGTAGSYGRCEPMQLYRSYSATQLESCFFQKGCYTPIENKIIVEPPKGVSRETTVTVNSSNYITSSHETAKHYLRYDIDLENMEFYAIMRIAQRFGIPVGGVFVVTNYCDENAHRDFLKNRSEAMRILESYIKENF